MSIQITDDICPGCGDTYGSRYHEVAHQADVDTASTEELEAAATCGAGTILYDYERQAWIVRGKYMRCSHPEGMVCGCYGREHEGETAPAAKTEPEPLDDGASYLATVEI